MRLMRVLAVMAVTAVLVGCAEDASTPGGGGGGGTDAGGGGQATSLPDPCTLVTKAEVETAVGGPVADGVESPDGPGHYAFGTGRLCSFVPDGDLVSTTTISVFQHSDDGWVQYKENQASYSSYTEVPGVGEEAVSSNETNQIGFHQAGYVVEIALGLYVPHDPAAPPRVLALANAAAGRLGP